MGKIYSDIMMSPFNINACHHYEEKRKHSQEEIDILLELQSNGHEMAHHGFSHLDPIVYSEQFGFSRPRKVKSS